MSSNQDKIDKLCEEYGFDDSQEMLEEMTMMSVVPAICMNDGCDATYEYEPDCTAGWCGECEENTVKSILILEGII